MRKTASNMSYEEIFKIHFLRVSLEKSFREIEKILNLPKSTIHYNLPGVIRKIDASKSEIIDETQLLVFFVLSGVFEGKMAVRCIESMITTFFKSEVSHQTLLSILVYAAEIAKELNKEVQLDFVICAIFDEIFQKSDPILSMADPISGLIQLKAGLDRSGDEWKIFSEELKERGLDPDSVNTDGGTGLLK